jgi:inositol phosphorylceramide mannosyltransferase catalytic subunit
MQSEFSNKKLHFIWIGQNQLDTVFEGFISRWIEMYSDWEIIIWDDEKLENQIYIPHRLKSYCSDINMKPAFKVDIFRYLVLNQIGGMYIDVDFEPLKKIPDAFFNFDFLGTVQINNEVANGLIYSKPNSDLINEVISKLPDHLSKCKHDNVYDNKNIPYLTGPQYFDTICKNYFDSPAYHFFTYQYFYPYWYTESSRRHEDFSYTSPLAYAVHHWNASWTR